jgi:hypothetical protein
VTLVVSASVQAFARFPRVRKPARGTFLPWSEGSHAFFGRRFSEVEMTAILATLFSRHRCEIRRLDGESVTDATRRVQSALDRSTMHITLAVRERVDLIWYPRSELAVALHFFFDLSRSPQWIVDD